MTKNDQPDPIDVQVGITIRRVRKERGLSQTEIATAIGITFQQFQKYERGANRISASMLVKTARVLGVRAGDLLPEEGDLPPAEYNLRLATVKGAGELLERYEAIRFPRYRRSLLQLAQALAAEGGDDEVEAAE